MGRPQKQLAYKETPQGCWEVTSHKPNNKGYIFIQREGENKAAHRYALEIALEEKIPKGLVVMHVCDNPSCVNPLHLEVGTFSDNNMDAVEKGRGFVGELNGSAKLTEEAVKYIYLTEKTPTEVAKEVPVEVSQCRRIQEGRMWTHVTENLSNPREGSKD